MQQGGQLATIDFVNILLAVAAVLLLFFLYEKATGSRWIAFLAALLTATNPGMAMASVFPWTESLYLLLQTASLLLLMVGMERLARLALQPASAGPAQTDSPMPAPESKSRAKALQHAEYCLLAAGFAAALAYLTRPNALAFIAALVLVLLVSRAWRSLALFLFPCAAMLAIWFALVWAVKGDPFYSVQNHHLRVAYITDGMRAGWGAHIPTAAEFARTHSIPRLIASSAWKYITFLFSPM
jgi:4-amino-4-deoxy-L-arabinose transferase-like glycosyltransferase